MKNLISISTITALLLSGCVMSNNGSSSPDVYTKGEMQKAQVTQFGEIISLKPIKITGESNVVLNVLAAGLGGLAGYHVGGGSGKIAGSAVGAVLGGMGADKVGEMMDNTEGVELVIKLENANIVTYAQEGGVSTFKNGDRVKIVTDSQGKSRVDVVR
ncbi:hypothetical protein KDD93_06515 [Campylobacter sp. faydin G-24]|uniref:Glycine zipper 2TM domain-containing protein n=1 Tax=Campylobacter anatolicus TaxID=2829105 RepID=A0ABS5HKU9_9BACT|nr:hypothetical protein [Campylobacter anatolicus]MBR8461425.1 hypothetical protein [Campylobacter anatolicus]MBR8464212.1 hypothetical protein [Campylobacter anatolicus]